MQADAPSLRRKLLVWLLLPLLVLFLLRALYNYHYGDRLSDHVYDRMLLTLANSLAQQIVYDTDGRSITLPPAAAEILMGDETDSLYFAVRDAAGRIVYGEQRMPEPPEVGTSVPSAYSDGMLYGRNVRIVNLRTVVDGRPHTVQIAETRTKRWLLSREFQTGVILPQMVIIALAVLIVWFGIGKSLAPLKRLQAAVSQRSHRDLSPLSGDDIPAEVQPLVEAINELMARSSVALEAQNRFIADAAHQLRTPLAGLKAQIELAQRQDDPVEVLRSLDQLRVGTDRMARLVGQLLALARNGPEVEAAVHRDPVDLGALASRITMDWVPRAIEKQIDLGFDAPSEPVIVAGDASRLKDLLDNLIDNARRYTQSGGRITVGVRNTDDGCPCLTVSDDGPGIPADQREQVFERFYSLLGRGADGSGLGLAIVREIAAMHGGSATITGGPGDRGTCVTVVFGTPQAKDA